MGYSDNPRRIYGRVEIIYSDSEIAKDYDVTTNVNSEISHPEEVIEGPEIPTVKACTMDGHSTMDGTFQMMDDSVECGWWSGPLANANGLFNTAPIIELRFFKRPVISWIIVGDTKLGQYPVDFIVEFLSDGNVVHTERVTGNTEMQVRLTPTLEDITSIRMRISRWSVGNACAKILKFYDRLAEVYEGDALQMFEVNEEMSNAEGNYNINSDTMTVTVYNEGRKFDKGYLRSLMILDRKLRASIGVEKNGRIEYTLLGTFYSDEWQVAQDSQWVKCRAVDKLLRLQNKTYVGFALARNVSLYEIVDDIFQKLEYTPDMYYISADLKDIVVPMAFLPKQSAWDALQEIANAGLCKVYVDRQDKVVVRSEKEASKRSIATVHNGNMFAYSSSISLTKFANRISVEYCDVTLSDDLIEVVEVEICLDPEATLELTLDYSTECAYAAISCNNANVKLSNFKSGTNACTVIASNTSKLVQFATLTVTGNAIEISSKTLTVQDEDSVKNSGVIEYSHPASELVQSTEHAELIARTLLRKMHAGEGVVSTTWRGTPELELGDEYTVTDRFGDDTDLICEFNKFSYDGGLKQESRGRTKGG